MTLKEWGLHYNRGRPHSSLGPGIPEPNQDSIPASDHRHKLPAGYRVVKTSVLGGLHHEYRLVIHCSPAGAGAERGSEMKTRFLIALICLPAFAGALFAQPSPRMVRKLDLHEIALPQSSSLVIMS